MSMPNSRVEFQAVIMAGGMGNRMYPLTSGHVKCLLPVVNRPLLVYQIEILERSGFADAIVVVQEADKAHIQQSLAEHYTGDLRVDMVCLSEQMGTADAFRQPQLRSKITTDFFVLSGDLVTNVFMHYLADIHRSRDASLTVLLAQAPTGSKDPKSKKDAEDDLLDKHFIGLDNDKNRLLVFESASDIEGDFSLRKGLLRRHPNLSVHNNLVDAHLYIMSPWVLDLIDEKKHISSIQAELLPYLVSHQFSSKADNWMRKRRGNGASGAQERDSLTMTMGGGQDDDYDDVSLALGMSHADSTRTEGERYSCYAFITDQSSLCMRANTVRSYELLVQTLARKVWEYTPWKAVQDHNQANKARQNNPNATIGPHSICGANLVLKDGASIKKSVVGNNVTIKAGAKVVNSILMDGVVVQENCVVDSSIVGKGAKVTQGSTLKDHCRLGHGASTAVGGNDYKKETITLEDE